MLSPLKLTQTRVTLCYPAILILFFTFSIRTNAQVQIWGVSEMGGADEIGSVFNILDTGTDYQLKSEFLKNREGNVTQTQLVLGSDGAYYGISATGGVNGGGTLFRYSDENGFEVLYNLVSAIDGSGSKGDMIEAGNGIFVGTTAIGGENGSGTLFQFSVTNGFSVLHNFSSANDGANPSGALAFDGINAKVYGTCSNGGDGGYGTCFAYSFATGFHVIYEFLGGIDGSYPRGGVILASDGKLYGTTQSGGANSQGSVFSISIPSNSHNVIYNISASTSDGRYPYGNLLESSPGVFLGTCYDGGTSGSGTVFKVTSSGTFTRLRSLQSGQDGGFPKTGLGKSDSGQFYGITEFGGSDGFGTIYEVTEDGIFTKVHDFKYTADGSHPRGGLISNGAGKMVGATPTGGANGLGTLYELTGDQEVVKLHDFSVPLKGSSPKSVIRNGNQFYGITSKGGAENIGAFYKIELDGTRTKLHDFNAAVDGQNPNGDLFLAEDGKYYGTAPFGGENQSGTVFSITEEGAVEVLHNFGDASNGQFPYGGVVLTDDGTLYGTTYSGGMPNSGGTLYSISPEGVHTVVHQFFDYFDGANPQASLTIGTDGKIYGLNNTGGANNGGTLFEYDPATSTFLVDHNFDPSAEGSGATGKLLLHSDGSLYGTTLQAGVNGGGSIFRYSADSGFEMLHAFDPATEGMNSSGGLAEDEEGKIIGFCNLGGANNKGTCFGYSDADGFNLIYSFSSESPNPTGTPALFFPECYGDEGCSTTDSCSVAICNYGLCEEIPINPSFTAVNIGQCEVGLDLYDLELSLSVDINPGGTITIAGQPFDLTEGVNTYQFTLTNLPADAEVIDLDYTFDASGCAGSTGNIGTAPIPCPPIEITFILNPGDLEVNPEGIHIGGSFQGWTPSEYPMELNTDELWEATITIGSGDYQFNFFNGSTIFDGEYVIGECASSGKRNITVGAESETVAYCWARCQADCSVGINELMSSIDFKIVPNITSRGSEIYLELPDMSTDLSYSIVDVAGKILEREKLEGTRTGIYTDNLAPGMYNLILTDRSSGEIRGVKRFVIQ